MRNQDIGIISYAGLDKSALWRQAKQYYSQDEGFDRFSAFLPLFPVELIQNMRFVGRSNFSTLANRNGFSIDPNEYHRQLYSEMPQLYAGENYKRNFDFEDHFVGRGVMTVDQAWADHFPQYEPFLGERLVLYMIGGGGQAVVVPESIYPRGCGVLRSAEMDMRISSRGDHYASYVQARVDKGEEYDPLTFGREYLRECMLDPVTFTQKELGRVMQDMSLVRSLQEDEPKMDGHFSEFSRRGENLPQYVPYHVACDTFESAPVTRNTARLMQLYFSGDEHVSDLWFSYQEASEYIDRQTMTLDVRSLCRGFQIPPRYDPETLGGKYPDQIRLVTVRDRSLQPMLANTINNPAYGSGMNPMGMINRLVLLEDSAELLRVERLGLESCALQCENLAVSQGDYIHMVEKAALQENKGLMIDTMYRREAALSQLREGSEPYCRAKELLDQQLRMHQSRIAQGTVPGQKSQLSGYDADIDYLQRMEQSRLPAEDENQPPLVFTPDALRMLSIESGCTMRSEVRRYSFEELALPAQDEEEFFEPVPQKPEMTEQATEETETVSVQEERESEDEIQKTLETEDTSEQMPAEEENKVAEADEKEQAQKITAQDQLSLLMQSEGRERKKEKSLWSRTLPKAEQISLFEDAGSAGEEVPRVSMKENLHMEQGAGDAMQKPSKMSQLIPPPDEQP